MPRVRHAYGTRRNLCIAFSKNAKISLSCITFSKNAKISLLTEICKYKRTCSVLTVRAYAYLFPLKKLDGCFASLCNLILDYHVYKAYSSTSSLRIHHCSSVDTAFLARQYVTPFTQELSGETHTGSNRQTSSSTNRPPLGSLRFWTSGRYWNGGGDAHYE